MDGWMDGFWVGMTFEKDDEGSAGKDGSFEKDGITRKLGKGKVPGKSRKETGENKSKFQEKGQFRWVGGKCNNLYNKYIYIFYLINSK